MNSRKRVKNSRSKSNEETSFIRNITSRMTSILSSTITKWLGSPNSSSANGHSSTEDESIEIQQPAKRICYSSPGKFDLYMPSIESNCVNNGELTGSCTSHTTIPSPHGRNTFRKESNYASTPVLSNSEDLNMENNERKRILAVPKSPVVTSVGNKRKSLFSNDDESTSNTVKNQKLPVKQSFLRSPFYPGGIMYSGASSSYINQSYIRQPKITIINKNHDNIDNTLSHASKRIMVLLEQYSCPLIEAQRIPTHFINNTSNTKAELRTHRYASLLQLKRRSQMMDSTSAARKIIASYSSTKQNMISQRSTKEESKSKCTFKIKNLIAKSIHGDDLETLASPPINLPKCTLNMDLNKLPKFTLGNAVDTKSLVNTPALKNSEIHPSTSSQSNNLKRITSNISQTFSYNGKSLNSSEIVKSSIFKFSNPLTIDTITIPFTPPKFVFPSPERNFDKSNESMLEVKAIEAKLETVTNSSAKSNVLISQIVKKSIYDSEKQCSGCSVKNRNPVEICTTCSSAKTTNKNNNASEINTTLTAPLNGFPSILRSQSEKWECSSCFVRNDNDKTTCVCCETEKPGEKKDVPESTSTFGVRNTSGLKSIINSQSEKWECSNCLVRNDNDKSKCVCCETEKPGEKKDVPKSTFKFGVSNTSRFKTIINPQSEKWECSNCLVCNDNDKSKCVCCETEKPGEKKDVPKSTFKFGVTNTSGLKSIINSQSEKWECSNCLVRNDNDKSKCVCCETEKPGEKKDVPKSTFKFGVSNTSGFKTIINSQSEKWECSSCLVRNDNDKTSCVCCQTEKPGEKKDVPESTPNFELNIPLSVATLTPSSNTIFSSSVTSITSMGVNSISVNAETGTSLLLSKPVTFSSPSASTSNSATTIPATIPASMFIFGNSTQVSHSHKTKFSFGADKANTTIFTPTFGSDINTFKFSILPGNTLGSENLSATNVSETLSTNPLIPNSTVQSSNNVQGTCTTGLLNTTINKENMWTPKNTSNNIFIGSIPNSTVQSSNNAQGTYTTGLLNTTINKENMWTPKNTSNDIFMGSIPNSTVQSSNNAQGTYTTGLLNTTINKENMWTPKNTSNDIFMGSIPNSTVESSNNAQETCTTGLLNTTINKENTWTPKNTSNNIFIGSIPNSTVQSNNNAQGTYTTGLLNTTINKENMWTPKNTSNDIFMESIPNSTVQSSNNAQETCTTGLLNTTINKENTWTPKNTSNNIFIASTMPNNSQKPAFNFGSSMTFGSGNIGGFSTSVTSPSNMFVGVQSLSSEPGQTINFGASQPSTMFGFGQQLQTPPQQNQQAQPQRMYNFGASVSASLQELNSLRSEPYTTGRRMRQAVRRIAKR